MGSGSITLFVTNFYAPVTYYVYIKLEKHYDVFFYFMCLCVFRVNYKFSFNTSTQHSIKV